MTRDKKFKAIVRRRMVETGQTYTSARAEILSSGDESSVNASSAQRSFEASQLDLRLTQGPPEWGDDGGSSGRVPEPPSPARVEHEGVLGRFMTDGRLHQVPMKRRMRVHVLLFMTELFEPQRRYQESEVNHQLRAVHEDTAFWRRELVNYGYLQRDAGIYWLPSSAPVRPDGMRQEIPDWERVWLPGHLSGGE